jgi:Ca-activated chloride channel family protein
MQSSIRVDHSLLAVESEHRVHAMLEVTAPDVEGSERPALHLALVIDRSGSMAGGKLDAAKQAARFLVDHLGASDSLALVAFDNKVSLLAPADTPDKDRLTGVIESIRQGGTTNLSGGWLKGAEELRRVTGDGQRRVLLLTDGHANVGVTDPGRLTGMAQGIRGSRISTTTIGFGRDFDEVLLTAMADAGGGNGYFAEGPDDAPGIFGEEFEGLATVAAQNVSVEITPISDVKFIGVLNEYPMTTMANGVQAQLGDFYGGELRRVVFEFAVPNVADLGQKHIADVVLRYTTIGDPVAMHEVTIPIHVNVVKADEAEGAGADRLVVDEVLILKAAEDRKRASDLADDGRYDAAAEILEDRTREMRVAMMDSSRSDEMSVELDEMGHVTDKMRRRTYDAYDKKRMRYESQRNMRSKPHKEWENPDDKDKW